jgi:hypothetical protein
MRLSERRSTAELAHDLSINCSDSELVRIDEAVLKKLAEHIQGRSDFSDYQRSKWDDPRFWNVADSPERRSQYFTIGNAINYRFWRLVGGVTQPAGGAIFGEKFIGSMYLWRSLRRCLDAEHFPILDAKFLSALSRDQFDAIFADDEGVNPLAIAADDRIANLRDLGSILERDWRGQFYNLVRAAGASLVRFVRLSSRFRAFDDPNFKLVMVNAILHSGSGIGVFDGDPLPGIDYHLLKQLLRHGVLRPAPELVNQIEGRKILAPSDGQELRRVALVAFIRMSELTGVSGGILDNKWWWNRTKCRDKDPVCIEAATANQCPFYGPCEQRIRLRFPLEETRYY